MGEFIEGVKIGIDCSQVLIAEIRKREESYQLSEEVLSCLLNMGTTSVVDSVLEASYFSLVDHQIYPGVSTEVIGKWRNIGNQFVDETFTVNIFYFWLLPATGRTISCTVVLQVFKEKKGLPNEEAVLLECYVSKMNGSLLKGLFG